MTTATDWSVRLSDGRVLYEPEPKQVRLHESRAPNVLYGGEAGGGKSHGLRWHGIIACLAIPECRVLLLRREYEELNRTHLLKLDLEVPEDVATWHSGDKRLTFLGNHSMLMFGHCRTRADFRKHLSTEWDLILVDESGELEVYMLELLPSRLRTTKLGIRPQYVLGSNPGGEGHEYNFRRFIAKDITPEEDPTYDPEDYEFIPASLEDNPYIDDVYIQRLEALPEYERRRFRGDWSIAPDRAFPTYSTAHHVYRAADLEEHRPEDDSVVWYKPWWEIARSLDWGYGAATSIGWWLVDDDGWLWRAWELYLTQYEVEEQVPLIREIDLALDRLIRDHARAQQIPLTGEHPLLASYTVADPSIWDMRSGFGKTGGPTIYEQYVNAGLRDLRPADNRRVIGWSEVRRYLNPKTTPEIRFEDRCYQAKKQIGLLRRDPNNEDDVQKYPKQEDHAADEIRYFVMSRPKAAFRPVEPLDARHEPGTASWHEAKQMVKVEKARKGGRIINHPTLGPIKIGR